MTWRQLEGILAVLALITAGLVLATEGATPSVVPPLGCAVLFGLHAGGRPLLGATRRVLEKRRREP